MQDLAHLGNALTSASPRYAALNMAICGLIEDFGLVGFETLAVEVRLSREFLETWPLLNDTNQNTGQTLDAQPDARHRPRDRLCLRAPR